MYMSIKIIPITIPEDKTLPDIINSFSPEENYVMLKIGCECLSEGRKVVAGFSQKEIYDKIKNESREQVEKIEMDLIIEKETSKKMEEKISKMYEGQIDQTHQQLEMMKQQLDAMRNQLKVRELENIELINTEVDKTKTKYELLLLEKDRQNQLNREAFEKAEKLLNVDVSNNTELDKIKSKFESLLLEKERQFQQSKEAVEKAEGLLKVYVLEKDNLVNTEVEKAKVKFDLLLVEKDRQNQLNREAFEKAEKLLNKNKYMSSSEKGGEGEDIISYLSNTFKDFNGYRIENKAKQGHKGDFHLFFDEFNVLVDSKNYASSVYKKEIDKIEADLMTNDNMKFAWLVSLETDISGWNRFPIMNKWIMTDNGMKCIIFVNNLLENKYPQNTLRLVWSICNEFHKLIKSVDVDDDELNQYREREITIKNKIKNLQERGAELKRNVNGSLNILKNMDNDMIDMLSCFSNEIINNECKKYTKIHEWWNTMIEYTGDDENKIISTEIWSKFKKENKEYILETSLTIEIFKDIIYKIVGTERYIERTKKGAVDVIGFIFKDNILNDNVIISTIETEVIESTHKRKGK